MKNQPLIYGLLGFVSGAILVFLIGFIVMGGMMGEEEE